MGIDGGGSTVRVAITAADLSVIAQIDGDSVNPSSIGHEMAAARIQAAMRAALDAAGRPPLAAVGIGVAGAMGAHSEPWLRATVGAVLPGVPVAASSDMEIALVGAHGARRGVMVLAGTGSAACAVGADGAWAQAGGWGYMLGDEGSGYWLVMEALRVFTRVADGVDPGGAALAERMMAALGWAQPLDVVPWLYRLPPPTREIARYARIVLEAAAEGDSAALSIVDRGAAALAAITRAVMLRAGAAPDICFCGGLLTADNALSRALCRRLGLAELPLPRFAPVIGAALLAQLRCVQAGEG
jgi:N-acetylglucosamine kinase-like BadF-type ATPase